jgi:hypothetical protein
MTVMSFYVCLITSCTYQVHSALYPERIVFKLKIVWETNHIVFRHTILVCVEVKINCVGSEVLTIVVMKNFIFWAATPHSRAVLAA